jgi:hypothetical protein
MSCGRHSARPSTAVEGRAVLRFDQHGRICTLGHTRAAACRLRHAPAQGSARVAALRALRPLPRRLIAALARYARRPPLRRNSRLTVQGGRPSVRAIARTDSLTITPREISSRSAKAKANEERHRGCGRIPPVLERIPPTAEWVRSKSRAMACSDSPCRQRSHINTLSASVYWILVRYFMGNILPSTLRV